MTDYVLSMTNPAFGQSLPGGWRHKLRGGNATKCNVAELIPESTAAAPMNCPVFQLFYSLSHPGADAIKPT